MPTTTSVPKSALSRTKRAHAEMRACEDAGATGKQVREWRGVAAQANKEIVRLQRELAMVRERAEVERAIITEELRGELVDREANAVRTADRFRDFCDRSSTAARGAGASAGSASAVERAYDRAQSAAAQIEAAIAALCTHSLNTSGGTALLLAQSREEGSEYAGSDV
jgi:hypothetical protein